MLSKKQKTDQYHDVIRWAEERMTHLDNRVESSRKITLKQLHQGNCNAIEEEFFDWIFNSHVGKKSNVLFAPYYEDVESSSAE